MTTDYRVLEYADNTDVSYHVTGIYKYTYSIKLC